MSKALCNVDYLEEKDENVKMSVLNNFETVGTLDKIIKLDEELEVIAICIDHLISQPIIIQARIDAAKRIDKKLSRQRKILDKRMAARYGKS